MNSECDKYPFDYSKHILLKRITQNFRLFSEIGVGVFVGLKLNRCENCLTQGITELGIPFKFSNINNEEIKCTLFRMGLKETPYKNLKIMEKVNEYEEIGFCCETCFEIFEEIGKIETFGEYANEE